jgi:hypothetical protein
MMNAECRIPESGIAFAGGFDGRDEDRDQLVRLPYQVSDSRYGHSVGLDEQLELIGGLVQLLQATVHLAAELRRRSRAARFAVLGTD